MPAEQAKPPTNPLYSLTKSIPPNINATNADDDDVDQSQSYPIRSIHEIIYTAQNLKSYLKMSYDIGAVVLEWRNLDQLGVASIAMKSFDDTQFHFFQSFQAIPKKIKYAKPTLNNLKSKLRTIDTHSPSLALIIHGIFVQISNESNSSPSHLMNPLIYCLEMIFTETNKITAEHHLEVCLWLLSLYNNVCINAPRNQNYLNFNQCICETIKYHQNNNNLSVHGIENKHIKQQCYKNHLTPLKILLRNIHPKQRKCSKLDISKLIDKMLSQLGIHTSLSTVYITINDEQKISQIDNNNCDGWSCNVCTLINSKARTVCEVCNAAKPKIEYDFLGDEPYGANKYKENIVKQCDVFGINVSITDCILKTNIHEMSIGHIRLLFQTGISPLNIRIKDEFTKIICDINMNELLANFDADFSILKHANFDQLEDIYPLMVIHAEAKKDLIRTLSLCGLKHSTILRNYFGLISDYIYGNSFKNDDIYDNDVRVKYCQYHLDAAQKQAGVKNPDFFVYWLSKYCVTDTKFLNFYSKSQQLPLLKDFCEQRDELKPLLYQFEVDSYEKYNSYYY